MNDIPVLVTLMLRLSSFVGRVAGLAQPDTETADLSTVP